MTEENQLETQPKKVEVEVIQTEGKISLTFICDGAKLTKADSGYNAEFTQEVWLGAKVTKADAGRIPDIDISVHEKCGSKLTKADAGKA